MSRKTLWPGSMLHSACRSTALGVLLVACNAMHVVAQSATASVTGLVTDQTGAALPNATVLIVDPATNVPRTVVTNSQGYYSVLLLPPADYTVKVSAPGFSQFVQQNVHLTVGLTLKIDVGLKLGQASDTVVVNDEVPTIDTETSSLGQVIDNQEITDLPTNGRNSYSFAALVPGVLAPPGFTHTAFDEYADQAVSINGARPNQNLFLLDGGINSEPAFNGPGYFPSIDLVQEYRVQTNNFSAEYSNAAGGVVNVVTRSGSNRFHGSAYEFFRDDTLTANDFFSNRYGLPKGVFKFNQFGGTVGGRILKDRTFFFINYEGFRQTSTGLYQSIVPTQAQRTGDFSQTYDQGGTLIPIYDPYSTRPDPNNPGHYLRDQYPGNVIPQSKLNPVALALMAYYPLPNTPSTPQNPLNFSSKNPSDQNKDEGSLRIDQSISDKMKLFGRVSQARAQQPYANLFGDATPQLVISNPNYQRDQYNQTQATIDFTYTVKPTLLLELNTSILRYTIDRSLPGTGFNPTAVGLPSYFDTLASQRPSCFPTVYNESITAVGAGCALLKDAYQSYFDYFNLTKLFANHTIKFGAELQLSTLASERYFPAGPSFYFDHFFTQGPDAIAGNPGANSGYSLASELVGTPAGGSVTIGPNQIMHYHVFGGYIQDDWKVTPKLTLNAGIRYDFNRPFVETQNRITDFNPDAASPVQVPGLNLKGGLEFPGVGGLPQTMFDSSGTNVAPRLGFAFSPAQKMSLRGGYGIFFGPITGAGFNNNAVPNTGFLASTSEVTSIDGVHPLNTLSDPFPQGFIQPSGSSQGLLTGLGQDIVGSPRDRKTPYAQDWNLDLQQVLFKNVVLDIAYAGNHSIHLLADYSANQLPDQYLSLGYDLFTQVANPFYGIITSGPLSGPTVAREQLLRPYPQFGRVTIGGVTSFGGSTYNALQVKLEKRFSSGLSLLAAYTWSKLMDNVIASQTNFAGGNFFEPSTQDWDDLKAARTLSYFDIPQILSVTATYDLPFGHKKAFFSHSELADRLAGGWQLNTIVTAQSGNPYTILAPNTLYNFGDLQFANYNGQPIKKSGPAKDRLDQYFNANAFSLPDPFTYGNLPRVRGDLRAPGVFNTDLSGLKNFKLVKSVTGQFRAEAFNVFNHPQFNYPNFFLAPGVPTGQITSIQNSPRQIQLALKVLF